MTNHRRSIRMQSWDYSSDAAYFVTIVTRGRESLFGDVVGDHMQLSEVGILVERAWQEIPMHFEGTILDEFVIMPNHVHGILALVRNVGAKHFPHRSMLSQDLAANASPLPLGTAPGSLGAIVQNFKLITTRKANQLRNTQGSIWQRNYYERIIRNEQEMAATQDYIQANELHWAEDEEQRAQLT